MNHTITLQIICTSHISIFKNNPVIKICLILNIKIILPLFNIGVWDGEISSSVPSETKVYVNECRQLKITYDKWNLNFHILKVRLKCMQIYIYNTVKGKCIPTTGHEGPQGCGCKGPHIPSHGSRKR